MKAKSKNPPETALITGASSGIGRELARLFAKDGYDLVLVARNATNLERLARDLRSEYQVKATVIVQDLGVPSAPQAIVNSISSQAIEIDVLVNNAGTQVYGEFADASLEQLLAMVQVNAIALVQLTHLLLPGMIRRGHGRILNLGSTGSFAPGPLNAVYCASKSFVLSFSEAIGAELAGTGVTVTALCPGATDTAFITRHGMQDVRIFRNSMAPVAVAQIGYRALQHGRPLVVAGLVNQLQVLSFQLMAPFLGLTPPAWLMATGRLFMGRNTKSAHPQQIS
ncbi:MAG TPA: SDR family oxidoreductase [Anaerolineales bacterium]|nr:SDR family oxidoreductase [Anaerolineales bacterium]